MLFLLALFGLIVQTEARCYCAQFVRKHESDWIRKVQTGCNDAEMKAECERAEWELTDWVGAVMNYARTLAVSHPAPTVEEDAQNQAALSHAVEAERPVPDCATGLFTTTALSGDNWDYIFSDDDDDGFRDGACVSLELLAECEKVRDGMTAYVASVMSQLSQSEATSQFIELMRIRVEDSIMPTVTCNTTDYHQDNGVDKSQASGLSPESMALVLGLAVMIVFW